MVLKAAYFAVVGLAATDAITWPGNIQPAINRGRTVLGIAWPHQGQGHNVRAWAELLTAERALSAATIYAPALAHGVLTCGQRIGQLWSETLRYHKNFAYLHEIRQIREAAEWLIVHSLAL